MCVCAFNPSEELCARACAWAVYGTMTRVEHALKGWEGKGLATDTGEVP